MQFLGKIIRSRFAVAIAGLAFSSASCAVHPPVTETEMLAARTFNAPKGKGILFVYRPSTVRAMATPRPIFINRIHIVSNTNGTFVAIPLKPGTYRIQAAAQALFDSKEQREAYPEINLAVQESKSYFIRQSIEGSILGHGGEMMMLQTGGSPIPIMIGGDPPPFKAKLVDGAEGRQECSKLKLVGSDPVQ
ncbi:MAG: DUF2846 domain-containing protein [Luteolibacter sp.]